MKEIALAGNANSGKTTLFNYLTGANQRVGNWPGVTVERKAGYLKKDKAILLQDLPGIYSLSPYTPEELVTRKYLLEKRPAKIVDVVDATNIERNLYLTLQLLETKIPLVLALNMADLLKKQGRRINTKKLAYLLGIPVIKISALKRKNIDILVGEIQKKQAPPEIIPKYDPRLESALAQITDQLQGIVAKDELRFYAIKLFERDEQIRAELKLDAKRRETIADLIQTAEKIFDDESSSIIINARYDFISRVMDQCVIDEGDFSLSISDRIDLVVTNRFLALPIFFGVMWAVYYLSIQVIGTAGSDWLNDVLFGEYIPKFTADLLSSWQVAPFMQGLIIDGIIGGVGAVLGFLPQIMMLFLCLGILEDCGYMSRIAFVMDRIFRRFNLSGKSFIPLLVSTGCGVPGIMATRTIEAEKDRKMTIMLTTFMPCSAKLTVIALIVGTFFKGQSLAAPAAYFLGIIAVIGSGIYLKKTALFAGDPQPFVMELPAYHLPRLDNIVRYVWLKSKGFVQKAGTIIFASMVVIWFLSNFNFRLEQVPQESSMLKSIGSLLAPVFVPLGFGDWRAVSAVLTGLIAKENCVATLQVAFGNPPTQARFDQLLTAAYTPMAAYAFLAFNLLCAPCFAAIGAMHKEYGDASWTWRAIGYQTFLAYLAAMLIYQISVLASGDYSSYNVILVLLGITLIVYGLFIKKSKPQPLEQAIEMRGSEWSQR